MFGFEVAILSCETTDSQESHPQPVKQRSWISPEHFSSTCGKRKDPGGSPVPNPSLTQLWVRPLRNNDQDLLHQWYFTTTSTHLRLCSPFLTHQKPSTCNHPQQKEELTIIFNTASDSPEMSGLPPKILGLSFHLYIDGVENSHPAPLKRWVFHPKCWLSHSVCMLMELITLISFFFFLFN